VTTRDVHPPTAALARSWLLVNAMRIDEVTTALDSGADQIVLDLEDAVAPAGKDAAREALAAWLESTPGRDVWVRVNDRTSPFWRADLERLLGIPRLAGVMLAKTDLADQVAATFDLMNGTVPVLALIESALGIEEAVAIARARGTFRLAFGSGDYRRDTGTSADDLAMAYPRSRLVVASRVGDLPGPIDGPALGSAGGQLRERVLSAASLGLTGKLCLDAAQAPVLNEALSPARADVAWASAFLAEFDARGCVIRDGSDLPRLGRARRIDRLARAFDIVPESVGPGSSGGV
jgi:citrate lyase subunit beta/citryl-CoA lyase